MSDDTGELLDDREDDANRVEDPNRTAAPTAAAVLHHIVSSIVDDPAAVRVDTSDDGRRVRLDVRVGPGDLGRVIGRRGRTAQSIRTVVRAAAARDETDVDIEFVDD